MPVPAPLPSDGDTDSRTGSALTPLMMAAGLGRSSAVEALLASGADPNAVEPVMGATALHKAAQSGSADVLRLLLDAGAFIDQQSPVLGNTPLIDAVLNKQEQAVGVLLDRGARTVIRNHWQQSALSLARYDGLDAIARLIEARDLRDKDLVRGLTLHDAVTAGNLDEVERLLAAGADVARSAPVVGSLDDDYTPLGLAARAGDADMVAVLLGAGADPGQRTGLMRGTAIHEAAFFGHTAVVGALADNGGPAGNEPVIDVQGAYNGLTALHDAVWHGHAGAARALVEAGARLDLRTHAGATPRDLAVLYGYDEIADFLADAERA